MFRVIRIRIYVQQVMLSAETVVVMETAETVVMLSAETVVVMLSVVIPSLRIMSDI